MGVLSVDEAKLAVEFGKQLRAIIADQGGQLAAGAVDEEKLAKEAVAALVSTLRENRVHMMGTFGGMEADLLLWLESKEAPMQ
jgi:hypothetical protein